MESLSKDAQLTYTESQISNGRQGIGNAHEGLESFGLIALEIGALQAAHARWAHGKLVHSGQGRAEGSRASQELSKKQKL